MSPNVGGLPYQVTEDQLREIFSAHGTVESATVITDRMTGRSKGFGFVEMSSQEEAQQAIDKLNGTDLEGRNITVNEAKPRQPRSGGGGRGGYGRDRWQSSDLRSDSKQEASGRFASCECVRDGGSSFKLLTLVTFPLLTTPIPHDKFSDTSALSP